MRLGIAIGGIIFLLAAAVFWMIRPFNQQTLNSNEFRQYLTQRLENWTGLKVQVAAVELGANLSFRLKDVLFKRADDSEAPACHVAEITGSFAKRGLGWHFDRIDIQQPTCRLPFDATGHLIGLKSKRVFGFADARLLGGLRVDQFNVQDGDFIVTQKLEDGSLQETRLQKLEAQGRGIASLFGIDVGLKLKGPAEGAEPMFFSHSKSANTMAAAILGVVDLRLKSMNEMSSQFDLEVADQDFVPTYDSKAFPLHISGKAAIKFDDEAKLRDMSVKIGDAMTAEFKGRFYYTDKQQVAHFDFSDLKLMGSDRLRVLLGQTMHQSIAPLFTLQNAKVEAVWDLRKPQDNFELKFLGPELKVHIDDQYQVSFEKINWHLLTSSQFGHIKVPYKSKISAEKMLSPAHGLTVANVYAAGEGEVVNGTRIDFAQFAVGTQDVTAVSVFSGFVDFSRQQRNVLLAGRFFQKLESLAVDGLTMKGWLKGPFTLQFVPDSHELAFESSLDVDVEEASSSEFQVANLKMQGPIRMIYDYKNSLVDKPAMEGLDLLQRYLVWYSRVENQIQWQADLITVVAPAALISAVPDDQAKFQLRLEKGLGVAAYQHKAPNGAPHLLGQLSSGKTSILKNGDPITDVLSVDGGWSLSRVANHNQLLFFLNGHNQPDMELVFNRDFKIEAAQFSRHLLNPTVQSGEAATEIGRDRAH